jgi:hypothetical protein
MMFYRSSSLILLSWCSLSSLYDSTQQTTIAITEEINDQGRKELRVRFAAFFQERVFLIFRQLKMIVMLEALLVLLLLVQHHQDGLMNQIGVRLIIINQQLLYNS